MPTHIIVEVPVCLSVIEGIRGRHNYALYQTDSSDVELLAQIPLKLLCCHSVNCEQFNDSNASTKKVNCAPCVYVVHNA